jgi:hypothetical protein
MTRAMISFALGLGAMGALPLGIVLIAVFGWTFIRAALVAVGVICFGLLSFLIFNPSWIYT